MRIVPSTAHVTETGLRIDVSVPPAAESASATRLLVPPILAEGRAIAGPDFASVIWHGRQFRFTPKQAAIISELWYARHHGYEYVTAAYLLSEAESSASRVRDLFCGHPAWGTLIQSHRYFDGPPGTFRLAPGPV